MIEKKQLIPHMISEEEEIQKALIRTLCYFDQFSHPLTLLELHDFLWNKGKKMDFSWLETVVSACVRNSVCETEKGFYFLPGKADIVNTRLDRLVFIEKKMERALRTISKLRWIPYLRACFVCNTVALGWPSPESDIDIVVVAKDGRLWLVRALVTLTVLLLGKRRGKKNIQNQVCLSFYVSESALDFSRIRISDTDIYLMYWIRHLIPVYDPFGVFSLLHKKNQWVSKHIAETSLYAPDYSWSLTAKGTSRFARSFFLRMQSNFEQRCMEKYARFFQKTYMNFHAKRNKEPKDPARVSSAVIVSDNMLKFHENDRRVIYRDAWRALCKKYEVSEE